MNRNRARILAFAVVLAAVLLGCKEPSVPGWQVLFSDGFNRADTAGPRDLGSTDYTIYVLGSTDATTMVISSNQVECHFVDGSYGITAAYNGTVDYTQRLKVSVKFKVSSSGEVPFSVGGMAVNLQSADFACYAVQVNSAGIELYEFDGTTIVDFAVATYTLANDTWYRLEMESNGLALTARLKDASSGAVLVSCTYMETGARTYMDGSVGFFNFTTSDGSTATDQPVYFEDFSVSAWR
jgi:hypothetical protein